MLPLSANIHLGDAVLMAQAAWWQLLLAAGYCSHGSGFGGMQNAIAVGITEASEQIPKEATGDKAVYGNVQNPGGSTWEVNAWSCENEAVSAMQTLVGWRYQGHGTSVMESYRQPAEPSQDNGHTGSSWENHITQDCQVFWRYSHPVT